MNWRSVLAFLLLAAFTRGLAASPAPADEARAEIGGSRFIAADVVELQEDIGGSAFLAGGRIRVGHEVGRSAWLAGGQVGVSGRVGRNLSAAGGEVVVDGPVGGRLLAAGGEIRVGRTAVIEGNAALAGGEIEFAGEVGGDLRAYGESILINGTVRGDLVVDGADVRIGPEARIDGRLRQRGTRDVDVATGAEIRGGVHRHHDGAGRWSGRIGSWHGPGGRPLLTGALLCGVLLVLAAPRFSREAGVRFRREPLASGLVGLLLLVGVPFAALLAILTIIGVPVGLLLLFGLLLLAALGMATALLAGGDAALAAIRATAAEQAGWRLLFLLFATLAVWLVAQLPVVGWVTVFLLLLAGSGAFAQQFWRQLRT